MKTYFYERYGFEVTAESWDEAAAHVAEHYGYCDPDELFEMDEEDQ